MTLAAPALSTGALQARPSTEVINRPRLPTATKRPPPQATSNRWNPLKGCTPAVQVSPSTEVRMQALSPTATQREGPCTMPLTVPLQGVDGRLATGTQLTPARPATAQPTRAQTASA